MCVHTCLEAEQRDLIKVGQRFYRQREKTRLRQSRASQVCADTSSPELKLGIIKKKKKKCDVENVVLAVKLQIYPSQFFLWGGG